MTKAQRRLVTAAAVLGIVIAVNASAFAQETQPGDPCIASEVDQQRKVGGPENPDAGLLLICDGSAWNLVYEFDNNANLGVKRADPKAPLHVGGEAIIGNTGLVCDADRAGGIRWSSVNSTLEMCNGFAWEKIVAALPTINLVLTPASKNNMDVDGSCGFATCTGTTIDFTLQNQGTLTSAAISVSLTNLTNFTKISDTCNGVSLAPNQTCVIQVQPKATGNLAYSGRLDITANNNPFAVLQGTATNFGCVPGRAGGGGIYAYCNLASTEGAYDLVVTPGGCTSSTINPTCAGGADTLAMTWGLSGQSAAIIPYNDTIGAQASVDSLAIYNSGAITAPTAIKQCTDLEYAGYTDWYLPAVLEFHNYIRPNRAAIGGFNLTYYWTSTYFTTYITSDSYIYDFGGSTWAYRNRNESRYIRCARRHDVALPPVTPDVDPDDVAFGTSVVTTPGARVYSGAIPITGFLQPVGVTVTSNTGNPKVKINGGAEVNSGTLTLVNQTVQLVMDAPAVSGNKNTLTLTIGPDNYTWYAGYTDGSATAYAFTTQSTWSGSIGGLGGADTKCQTAASNAGYGGTWKALLSDQATNAQDRIPFDWGVLRRLDNAIVANNWNDLWDGSLQNPISLSENLGAVTGWVHSATSIYGVKRSATSGTCSGWTSSGINDNAVGSAGSSGNDWVAYGSTGNSCGSSDRSLYCISANVPDTTPDVFTFTDQSNVNPAQLFESNIVQITGINAASPIYVSGSGTPEYRVCSNGTCSSVISGWTRTGGLPISNNQYLQVRQYSNGAGGGISDSIIDVGLGTDTWSLTTVAGDPCSGSPSPGAVCNDGTVYGGTSPAGGSIYFTRCDAGQTWSGTSCGGARASSTWNDGASNWLDISLINCGAAGGCDPNGETNTLVATLSDSNLVSAGTQAHAAAQYCASLTIHGYSDWYLPSAPELNTAYTNQFVIGGFNTSGSYYWTSSEFDSGNGWQQRFSDGAQDTSGNKADSYLMRCARRNLDITPASLSFTDQTGATAASVVSSNIIQISGIDSTAQIYILDGSGAEYRVCGDATCTTIINGWTANPAGVISDNNYLQLRQTAYGEAGGTVSTTVVVGDFSDTWTVTTAAGDPCAGSPLSGAVCSDGTVYVGTSPAGGAMYTTRCDYGMTWSGTACTNARLLRTWNDGNSSWVDTSISNCGAASGCDPDGEANTTTLVATDSNSVTVGQQLHVAAQVCSDLNTHSQTDWYLPSAPELDLLYQGRAAIRNFDTSGGWYFSSSEYNGTYGWQQRFSDGNQNATGYGKNNGFFLRCVRR